MRRARIVAALLGMFAGFHRPAAAATNPAAPLVIGESFQLPSAVLHETRRINVYFPPGFTAASTEALPVLVMPDGGMAEDFLHVAGLIEVSVGNGAMRPWLLVGIENTERRRDMTGPTENPEDRKIAPRVGGSQSFRDFIRSELLPEIRRRYRTTAETGIVGESLAGLFVVETFLREPDLFDYYVAIDPSVWWNNRKLLAEEAALLGARARAGKSLFVATSSEPGMIVDTRQFDSTLVASRVAGLRYHYQAFPDEGHGTIYHPAALRAFRMFFGPVPAPAHPEPVPAPH
jgi:predicted alpha/beta superfamily hydrolase